MRFLFLFSTLLAITSCSGKKVQTTYDDGKLMEEYYVNNNEQKDGSYTAYYPSGIIKEKATYKNNILTGVRTLYFQNGKPEIEERYSEDGQLNGIYKTYYPGGSLQLEKLYQNNVITGTIKVYYPSGQIKEEVTMADNEENGPFTEYYENGKIHWKGNYRNGDNEYGILYEFDSLGAPLKIMKCDTLAICRTVWKPGMPPINVDTLKI